MTYRFQSLARTLDLPRVTFRDYEFSTEDPELAEYVRRNCQANPHDLWEITPESPKRGRPPKVVRGMRTSRVTERET